jgi:hypothetical protein
MSQYLIKYSNMFVFAKKIIIFFSPTSIRPTGPPNLIRGSVMVSSGSGPLLIAVAVIEQ